MKKIRFLLFIPLMALSVQVLAQNITVSGTVTDVSTGDPIPYVTVHIQGTTSRTSTDVSGTIHYQLQLTVF